MADRYAEVSVDGRMQSRIIEPSGRERARQILLFLTTVGAVAAACMILAGVSKQILFFREIGEMGRFNVRIDLQRV